MIVIPCLFTTRKKQTKKKKKTQKPSLILFPPTNQGLFVLESGDCQQWLLSSKTSCHIITGTQMELTEPINQMWTMTHCSVCAVCSLQLYNTARPECGKCLIDVVSLLYFKELKGFFSNLKLPPLFGPFVNNKISVLVPNFERFDVTFCT